MTFNRVVDSLCGCCIIADIACRDSTGIRSVREMAHKCPLRPPGTIDLLRKPRIPLPVSGPVGHVYDADAP